MINLSSQQDGFPLWLVFENAFGYNLVKLIDEIVVSWIPLFPHSCS